MRGGRFSGATRSPAGSVRRCRTSCVVVGSPAWPPPGAGRQLTAPTGWAPPPPLRRNRARNRTRNRTLPPRRPPGSKSCGASRPAPLRAGRRRRSCPGSPTTPEPRKTRGRTGCAAGSRPPRIRRSLCSRSRRGRRVTSVEGGSSWCGGLMVLPGARRSPPPSPTAWPPAAVRSSWMQMSRLPVSSSSSVCRRTPRPWPGPPVWPPTAALTRRAFDESWLRWAMGSSCWAAWAGPGAGASCHRPR